MPYIVGIDTGGTFTGGAGWPGSQGARGADARLRPGEASNSGCQAGARTGGRISPTRVARRGSRGNSVCLSFYEAAGHVKPSGPLYVVSLVHG